MEDTDRIVAAILAAVHMSPQSRNIVRSTTSASEFRARAAEAASFPPPANTESGAAVKGIYNRHRPVR